MEDEEEEDAWSAGRSVDDPGAAADGDAQEEELENHCGQLGAGGGGSGAAAEVDGRESDWETEGELELGEAGGGRLWGEEEGEEEEEDMGLGGRWDGQGWNGDAETRKRTGRDGLTSKRYEAGFGGRKSFGDGGRRRFRPWNENAERSSEAAVAGTLYPGEDGGAGGRGESVSRYDRVAGIRSSGYKRQVAVLEEERAGVSEEEKSAGSGEVNTETSEEEKATRAGSEKAGKARAAGQKRKSSLSLASVSGGNNGDGQAETGVKKTKKKAVNIWAKTSSRKGGKKNSSKNGSQQNLPMEDNAYLTHVYRNQEKYEDGPAIPILLSRFHKAEKVELSADRLTAGSTKGYRMVRATRGVADGAWYFEITVVALGSTGHTRLGWSTEKGDVQAPVGHDRHSYAYRDVDGSKVHKAVREPYGEAYVEGDVIGFYINLPQGAELAPKPHPLIYYKGQPWTQESKEEIPKTVPGSEVSFFRNGVCQGVAFKDVNAGRYYPAASMYTLPNEPSCNVRFNFGPDFTFPLLDIGDRPPPKPMSYASYCGPDGQEVAAGDCVVDSQGLRACQSTENQGTVEAG